MAGPLLAPPVRVGSLTIKPVVGPQGHLVPRPRTVAAAALAATP